MDAYKPYHQGRGYYNDLSLKIQSENLTSVYTCFLKKFHGLFVRQWLPAVYIFWLQYNEKWFIKIEWTTLKWSRKGT